MSDWNLMIQKMNADISARADDLDEAYRRNEIWPAITDAALGIRPSDVESAARRVAEYAAEALAAKDSALTAEREKIAELERERDGWRTIVGDIAASVALPVVLKATGTTADMIQYFADLRTRAEAAEARLAEAEKVLEPFARAEDNEKYPDAEPLTGYWADVLNSGGNAVTFGHLRAARAFREGEQKP